jgi:hypothetical protein
VSEFIRIIAVIAIVGYVVARQLRGEPLRGKRVVLLPVILTVIGALDLHGLTLAARPVDVVCLVMGGVIVAGIGVAQGAVMRLESRNGSLWGQLPVRGLWLWLLLVGSRVVMTGVADGLDAKVAASGSTILLMLGINRLGQAAAVVPRAMSARIPFAPEKDGQVFLSGLTSHPGTATAPATTVMPPARPDATPEPGGAARATATGSTAIDWAGIGRQALGYLENRGRGR